MNKKYFIILFGITILMFCLAIQNKDNFIVKKVAASANIVKVSELEQNEIEFKKIEDAIELIKNLPEKTPYNSIIGNNAKNKPISISFKNLLKVNPNYANYEAVVYEKNKRIRIYINKKNNNAPTEAIAALIAGRTVNIDASQSKNEEILALFIESNVWTYFVKRNNNLKNNTHPLITREKVLQTALEKDNYSSKYIEKLIIENKAYTTLPKTSVGFSDEELNSKIKKVKEAYNFSN